MSAESRLAAVAAARFARDGDEDNLTRLIVAFELDELRDLAVELARFGGRMVGFVSASLIADAPADIVEREIPDLVEHVARLLLDAYRGAAIGGDR